MLACPGFMEVLCDGPGVCDPCIVASSMPEHPAAQQVEPGPSVHLPLDDLEPVDLALAVAPRFGQRGTHRILIAPEANGARALASASRSQPSSASATWSLTIVTKRLTRSTAVAMAGGGARSRGNNRGSAASSVSV